MAWPQRRKRAAERYAIKRMRRKFKGMQRGPGGSKAKPGAKQDWKAYYNDAKKAGGGKGKKK